MKKVLIVITTGFCSYGGLTSVAMNYYRNMDKKNLIVDFSSSAELEGNLADELAMNKSKYFELPSRKKNIFSYCLSLYKLLKKEKYDIIHIHGNSATMVFELIVAKLANVKRRIVHGHTTQSDFPRLHKVLFPLFNRLYTDGIAVSKKTGDWLYNGREYVILNNAIDLDMFAFNEQKRNKIRKDLELDDYYVIGNVGKLNISKNHQFLIKVFNEVKKKIPNSKLLIVGGGAEYNNLVKQAESMGIENDVILVGMKNNINDYLNAMDVFVFTSKFEGLGMALIEAQASGLFCICSDAVPIETKVTKNIKYLNLNDPIALWVDSIYINSFNKDNMNNDIKESIQSFGYDIKKEANKLRNIYLNEKGG